MPVAGGLVKIAEGMQYDKPLTTLGGMASIGFDLFGGKLIRWTGKASEGVNASWGKLFNYRHGGQMSAIEHIVYRHSYSSGFANVSRFSQGTSPKMIKEYVEAAIKYGKLIQGGFEYNFGRVIGTGQTGQRLLPYVFISVMTGYELHFLFSINKDCLRMVTLEAFIREEVNNHIREVILASIEQGKNQNKSKDELVFNRYSLEFFFQESSLIIYDDIFPEDEPLKLSLYEFSTAISNA